MPKTRLRNGTYLRDPGGVTAIYFSPYRFNDAASNFRNRYPYDDWMMVYDPVEESALWKLIKLQPGEYVHIYGGEIRQA